MTIYIVKEKFMVEGVKARMVAGAARLLARHGLEGTSFSEVLELTGAPRGSVYHHFPEGKGQLVGDAVDLAGANALDAMDSWEGMSPEQVTASFIALWRTVLERSDLQSGCAVVAVTVATGSPELLTRTAVVFRSWRDHLAALLEAGGLAPQEAASLAATLVAANEGAVVLARAEQSMQPFELVAEQLLHQVAALSS